MCCIACSGASNQDKNDSSDRRASLDVLDGLEDRDDASVVLVPKVMTATEIQEQKKQAQAIADIAQVWSIAHFSSQPNLARHCSSPNRSFVVQ